MEDQEVIIDLTKGKSSVLQSNATAEDVFLKGWERVISVPKTMEVVVWILIVLLLLEILRVARKLVKSKVY